MIDTGSGAVLALIRRHRCAEAGHLWAEYGARVGYALTGAATLDLFINGVSGDDDIDTRVHGGGLRHRF